MNSSVLERNNDTSAGACDLPALAQKIDVAAVHQVECATRIHGPQTMRHRLQRRRQIAAGRLPVEVIRVGGIVSVGNVQSVGNPEPPRVSWEFGPGPAVRRVPVLNGSQSLRATK